MIEKSIELGIVLTTTLSCRIKVSIPVEALVCNVPGKTVIRLERPRRSPSPKQSFLEIIRADIYLGQLSEPELH